MVKNRNILLTALTLVISITSVAIADIGQSAIITLVFPYGARSTGLGETFTGIADDAAANYYNPAGLGQAPLATTWKHHTPFKTEDEIYTAISAKRKMNFGNKERVWIGTSKGSIYRYNGKIWDNYDIYVIEEGDDLKEVTTKYLNVDNEKLLKRAERIIRDANEINGKKIAFLKKNLQPALIDSFANNEELFMDLIESILTLSDFEQNSASIFAKINNAVKKDQADPLAKKLVEVYSIEDKKFSEMIELKIPFTIAKMDSITDIEIDASERLWIASSNGLWRYDGSQWDRYSTKSGLPSNMVTSVSSGSNNRIVISTDKGLAIFKNSEWKSYTGQDGLPSNFVSSIIFGDADEIYAGTDNGLVKIDGEKIVVTDTSAGLLSNNVTALLFDSNKHLWVGGKDGIAVFNGTSWKRYKFPGSIVYSFAEYKAGRVWIGTNRGSIKYKEGKITTEDDGSISQEAPEWTPYHSKNALKGDDVYSLAVHGKDVWLVTDKTISQYNKGEMQFEFFGEPLLPAFQLPDLWHFDLAGVIPLEEWGTLGFFFNFLNFGENVKTDAQGREVDKFTSFEFVAGLSYGLNLREDFSIGLNIKYAHSALDRTSDGGVGKTFAVDASLLKRNLGIKNLDLGFMLQNMGPSVYYTSKQDSDPIPFTVRLGLSYTPLQTPIHNLMFAVDLEREIVYNQTDEDPAPFYTAIVKGLNDQPMREELEEIIIHAGFEYWYIYFLAIRMGLLFDEAGSRKEMNIGLGLKYGKFAIDWSYIHSPKYSEARDGQWRFGITVRP